MMSLDAVQPPVVLPQTNTLTGTEVTPSTVTEPPVTQSASQGTPNTVPETTLETLGLAGDVAQASFLTSQALTEPSAPTEQPVATQAEASIGTVSPLSAQAPTEPSPAILQAAQTSALASTAESITDEQLQAIGAAAGLTATSPLTGGDPVETNLPAELVQQLNALPAQLGNEFTIEQLQTAVSGIVGANAVPPVAIPTGNGALGIVDDFSTPMSPGSISHGVAVLLSLASTGNVALDQKVRTVNNGNNTNPTAVLQALQSIGSTEDFQSINFSIGIDANVPKLKADLAAIGIEPKNSTEWAALIKRINPSAGGIMEELNRLGDEDTLITLAAGNNPAANQGNLFQLSDVLSVSSPPSTLYFDNSFASAGEVVAPGSKVIANLNGKVVLDANGLPRAFNEQEYRQFKQSNPDASIALPFRGTSFGAPTAQKLVNLALRSNSIYDIPRLSGNLSQEERQAIRELMANAEVQTVFNTRLNQSGRSLDDFQFYGTTGFAAIANLLGGDSNPRNIGLGGFSQAQQQQLAALGGNEEDFFASGLSPRAYLASLQQNQQAVA